MTFNHAPADGQPRPIVYRCAGCGCTVEAPATAEPGDLCVCIPCSPHAAGNPRILELMHLAHARGLTLREAAEAAGYGAVKH